MSSDPISIVRGNNKDSPYRFNSESIDDITEKAYRIGTMIGTQQLRTQSQVTSFVGNISHFCHTKNVVDSSKIHGQQLYVPSNVRSIKIIGNTRGSYVISNIRSTTVFRFTSPVTHLTITNCSDTVIVIQGRSIAGIECINSRNIVIECESYDFVRVTTTYNCQLNGLCHADTLLDVRNSMDIHFNGKPIHTNVFTEGRFKVVNDTFEQLPWEEDISATSKSAPNLSVLKLW